MIAITESMMYLVKNNIGDKLNFKYLVQLRLVFMALGRE